MNITIIDSNFLNCFRWRTKILPSNVGIIQLSSRMRGKRLPLLCLSRPKNVEDVVEQTEVVEVLRQCLKGGDFPNLLFYGPPGTGKTSTILAAARQLFGSLYKERVLELNASDERGIQVVREKIKSFAQLTAGGMRDDGKSCPPFKIIVLDEADSMTGAAQAALRRTMEKESHSTRFCLICNYVSRIIEPLTSRCTKFRFKPLGENKIIERLEYICKEEDLKVEKPVLLKIVEVSGGDLRRAITCLQSITKLKGKDIEITVDDVLEIIGIVPDKWLDELIDVCKTKDYSKAEEFVDQFMLEAYATSQVIEQLSERIIYSNELTDKQKALIADTLGECNYRLLDGGNEYIQLINICCGIIKAYELMFFIQYVFKKYISRLIYVKQSGVEENVLWTEVTLGSSETEIFSKLLQINPSSNFFRKSFLSLTTMPDQDRENGQSDADYHGSNGQADTHSLHSSHLSVQEDPLLIRSHKQQTTQQVTNVSKVVREVSHMEPDPGAVSYMSVPLMSQDYQHADRRYPADSYMVGFEHYEPYLGYPPQPGYPGPHGIYMPRSHSPHSPHSPSEHSRASPPHEYLRKAAPYVEGGYNDIDPGLNPALQDHYRITPSPGGPGDQYDENKVAYGYVSPSPYGPVGYGPGVGVGPVAVPSDVPGYDEGHPVPLPTGVPPGMFDDEVHLQRLQSRHPVVPGMASPLDDDQKSMRWRDPNLSEVIGFLSNPNNIIKANAAAYLQHLCYMDDPNKQKTRSLGGIPPLVQLLDHDNPDVYRNACGALRNLSYGRQNDENKRAIKNAGGVPALINLLRRTSDADVKELVTGVLWNLSSCEDLKKSIIDDGVTMVVNNIIIPHSGWDPSSSSGETCWSTVFRNASGVLRNVSSAGEYARKKLRECDGLVDALLYVVRSAIEKSNIGNKIVENCVCILRNLSYRCQEVEDPNYDKHPIQSTVQNRVAAPAKGENLGCFGGSKKKKDGQPVQKETTASRTTTSPRTEPVRGMELLWQPEVVQSYLKLLQTCSNPETLEAAAGALQNLAACYWQPSIEIRAAVRKEKGLPILVELLRMEVDRVVCAVATALRNLAIDQRNKELIGKYAMRDLIQKLPSGNNQHDQGTSDDTIAAVLATLNEVIKKNAEFSRSLLDAGGVDRLMNITRQRQKYTPRVLKFAGKDNG
ncbi:Catenin delta-2 [Apis cerana cerana]|uniref:Catenin delta-2 n=1 Tax=Apis cerana cerana TaxID=94128 RepID=A0A2A3ENC6_APICC|nr:Catenin delta-2 [Apis cerana cerana]